MAEITEYPNAKFVRLQNGDDVVTQVVEFTDENGTVYTLISPLKIMYVPSTVAGFLQIAFTPWVFPRIVDNQEFVIHAEDVLMMSDVTEKMNQYYWQNVESYISTGDTQEDIIEEDEPEQSYESLKEAIDELLDKKRTLH